MSKPWRVRAAAKSITGNYRPKNEDRFFLDPTMHVFIVADGMGGQLAGEKASETAVELLAQRFAAAVEPAAHPPHTPDEPLPVAPLALSNHKIIRWIQYAVTEANNEIMALGELDLRFHGMGTTVVLAVIAAGHAYVTGVGDSRAYLIRGRKTEQLTRDHSVAESLAQAGVISREEVSEHRYRHMLWKYLGTKEAASPPEVRRVALRKGDRLLLASDGLTGVIPDKHLSRVLQSQTDPEAAVNQLIQDAVENDSHDNITCVVVYID